MQMFVKYHLIDRLKLYDNRERRKEKQPHLCHFSRSARDAKRYLA